MDCSRTAWAERAMLIGQTPIPNRERQMKIERRKFIAALGGAAAALGSAVAWPLEDTGVFQELSTSAFGHFLEG